MKIAEKSPFKGAYGIIVTPYTRNGAIDYGELERSIDRLCDAPIAGLVACGSARECAQLSPEENKQIMTIAARTISGRKPLVCGAIAGDNRIAVNYLAHMAKWGAAGALTAPPYYFSLNDDEVLEFYRFIAKNNSGVPIISCHIPQFTSGISLPVYEQLLGMDEIKGIKNGSGNFDLLMQQLDLRNACREDFSIVTGLDETLYGALAVGCDGSFTLLAYLLPELVSYIYEHFGKDESALKCQMKLLPLLRFAERYAFSSGYRAVGEMRGYIFGPYRQSLREETVKRMDSEMETVKNMVMEMLEKYTCKGKVKKGVL